MGTGGALQVIVGGAATPERHPFGDGPQFIIRDRDSKFGAEFDRPSSRSRHPRHQVPRTLAAGQRHL